jgi:phosphoglycolate phosphatase
MGNDVHKSKIEKIKMVFAKYNIGPENCVFVIDTLGDIKEATETGVKSLAVSWGFHNRETLLLGNPYKIIDRPEDLPPTLKMMFGKK